MRWDDPDVARRILTEFRTWAVVGCSSSPARASFRVARYLRDHDYEIVPVNPHEAEVFGIPCHPDLASVAESVSVDVVDIFRRADQAGQHVDEAIERGAKAVWMQLGVIDEEAAERAHGAGLLVVMDRCPAIDHPQMIGAGRSRS